MKQEEKPQQQTPEPNSLEQYIGIGIIVRKGSIASLVRKKSQVEHSIEYVDIERHKRFIENVFAIDDCED